MLSILKQQLMAISRKMRMKLIFVSKETTLILLMTLMCLTMFVITIDLKTSHVWLEIPWRTSLLRVTQILRIIIDIEKTPPEEKE